MNNIESNLLSLDVCQSKNGEIVLYQPNETIKLEVRVENETVWLTQGQLVTLFQSSQANISEHISNIYEQGELKKAATVRKFRTVQQEGNRMVTRTRTFYNLDAIISVGFRVNTKKGIEFRQWANGILKEYIIRGYVVNQQIRSLEERMETKFMDYDSKLCLRTAEQYQIISGCREDTHPINVFFILLDLKLRLIWPAAAGLF